MKKLLLFLPFLLLFVVSLCSQTTIMPIDYYLKGGKVYKVEGPTLIVRSTVPNPKIGILLTELQQRSVHSFDRRIQEIGLLDILAERTNDSNKKNFAEQERDDLYRKGVRVSETEVYLLAGSDAVSFDNHVRYTEVSIEELYTIHNKDQASVFLGTNCFSSSIVTFPENYTHLTMGAVAIIDSIVYTIKAPRFLVPDDRLAQYEQSLVTYQKQFIEQLYMAYSGMQWKAIPAISYADVIVRNPYGLFFHSKGAGYAATFPTKREKNEARAEVQRLRSQKSLLKIYG